ncbi:MAG TPA: hypothetical protein VGK32_19750 [Vicinamibacterales bacterium]|jgi:hypothetical protein
MDVYLVPVGRARYELYCESANEPVAPTLAQPSGVWRRLLDTFRSVVEAVEREHDHRTRGDDPAPPPEGWTGRMRVRVIGWVAEKIAEQRLLWRLQGRESVRAFFPTSIEEGRAHALIHLNLRSDADRHRWWLGVDTIALLFSLLLTPLPGPNLPGYYFTFRVVGHFLAWRGAHHGLRAVAWKLEPSSLLAGLCATEGLPPADRAERVQAIARELGLSKLARFVERTTVDPA